MSIRSKLLHAGILLVGLCGLAALADGISSGGSVGFGTGLTLSGGTVTNNAIDHISFQPSVTAVAATKGGFHKFSKASTLDNLEVSANLFTCSVNPQITIFECGTSTTCAASPVSMATATITAAGTVVDGSVTSASITAGDYVAFALTAGTCSALDIQATAQTHQN